MESYLAGKLPRKSYQALNGRSFHRPCHKIELSRLAGSPRCQRPPSALFVTLRQLSAFGSQSENSVHSRFSSLARAGWRELRGPGLREAATTDGGGGLLWSGKPGGEIGVSRVEIGETAVSCVAGVGAASLSDWGNAEGMAELVGEGKRICGRERRSRKGWALREEPAVSGGRLGGCVLQIERLLLCW